MKIGGDFVAENEKKKVTLSIPKLTNEKLDILSKKYGMSKSGLVNFLINKLDEEGNLYK